MLYLQGPVVLEDDVSSHSNRYQVGRLQELMEFPLKYNKQQKKRIGKASKQVMPTNPATRLEEIHLHSNAKKGSVCKSLCKPLYNILNFTCQHKQQRTQIRSLHWKKCHMFKLVRDMRFFQPCLRIVIISLLREWHCLRHSNTLLRSCQSRNQLDSSGLLIHQYLNSHCECGWNWSRSYSPPL